MKKNQSQKARRLFVTFFVCFTIVSLHLVSGTQNPYNVISKIKMSLTLPDGTFFIATVIEGGICSVKKNGLIYTFSPTIDKDTGMGIVCIEKGAMDVNGNMLPTYRETIKFAVKDIGTTQLDGGIIVEILSSSENYRENREAQIENVPARCCVTCDGWTACGCKVEHSCGSCCLPDCC